MTHDKPKTSGSECLGGRLLRGATRPKPKTEGLPKHLRPRLTPAEIADLQYPGFVLGYN